MGCSSHHRLNHLRVSSASLRRVPDSAANNGTRHGQHRHVRPGAPLFGRRRLHGDRLHVRDRGLRVGELDVRRVAIGLLRHGVRRSRSEEGLRTLSESDERAATNNGAHRGNEANCGATRADQATGPAYPQKVLRSAKNYIVRGVSNTLIQKEGTSSSSRQLEHFPHIRLLRFVRLLHWSSALNNS